MRTRLGVALIVATLTLGASFAVSGPAGAAAVHTVTVSPNTGLSDGQTVTVSGTGFDETPALNDWAIAQCDPAIVDAISLDSALRLCDATTQPFVFTHADAAGNLSTSYTVRKTFSLSGGRTVTCGQAPNDCAILVAQIATDGSFPGGAALISFGTPVKTVSECYREFRHDHEHSLRYRLHQLLACVVEAVHHRSR
jgi:hypothetical protein